MTPSILDDVKLNLYEPVLSESVQNSDAMFIDDEPLNRPRTTYPTLVMPLAKTALAPALMKPYP